MKFHLIYKLFKFQFKLNIMNFYKSMVCACFTEYEDEYDSYGRSMEEYDYGVSPGTSCCYITQFYAISSL